MPTFSTIPHVNVDRKRLIEFCDRNQVRALRLFGSILRQDFGPDSDVDILIEFEPGIDPDLLELGGM